MHAPDVLVLGAGGNPGIRWMRGVLAGITAETAIDFRRVEHLVGTSAGAVVAADLLAGRAPEGPAHPLEEALPEELEARPDAATADAGEDGGARGAALRLARTLGTAAATPLAPLALSALGAPGALVRARVLSRMPAPTTTTLDGLRERLARDGLRFDGRLRVVCVERESGRRVVFGAPGAPPAEVAEAVQASCSVPWLQAPVRIGGRDYVDGAIWSPTSLDVAPALRETHVLCLAPTAGELVDGGAQGAVRTASRTALAVETLALRRRGAVVEVLAPDGHGPADRFAAGFRQGRAWARGQ